MNRRFLVIALVFAVGFGVGLGATWLLVGSPEKTPQPVATPAPTAPAAPVAVTTTPPTETSAPTAPAPTEPSAADAGATSEADTAPTDAPALADVAVAAPTEAADTAVAVAAPDVVEPSSGDANAWWNRCHNKVCLVDWGRVSGGISVREGTLEHGEEVDWSKTFAKAEKVGTIEAKKNMKVEVLAIGMVDGKPGAAWIKYRKTQGVIALNFGDKSISFKPLER